jgi:CRISPR-associated protein Cmr3
METNEPKPTRRMAASGSVYFVELKCDNDAALREWIGKTWLHSISDRPEDRRDGFGLAALGVWPETTPCP